MVNRELMAARPVVEAAVNAAEQLVASNDPQWHRVFTETLQRLQLTKPQRSPQHAVTEDDPWLAELDRALGNLEGKVATADVWKVLKLTPYARTMEEHLRLTAAMRLLGWDRRLLRFRGGEGASRFRAGDRGAHYLRVCLPDNGEDQLRRVRHGAVGECARLNNRK